MSLKFWHKINLNGRPYFLNYKNGDKWYETHIFEQALDLLLIEKGYQSMENIVPIANLNQMSMYSLHPPTNLNSNRSPMVEAKYLKLHENVF